jgi:predicted ATP-grasp superfamily ATP-dependent carboligase
VDVLILGASARAAAFSALRAGLTPVCGDLFADRDLAAVCAVRRVAARDYPDGLAAIAAAAPPGPWLYTGALENHPDLVDRIGATRPLWGIGGTALRAVRDPGVVAGVLSRAALPCPAVRASPLGLPRDGSWLVKPRASAGGRLIRPLTPDSIPPTRPVYYQERIAGIDLAAIFLGGPAGARLLGVTRQWIGRPGAEFAYRGSLGPYPLPDPEHARVAALGRALSAAFGLAGLFGIDLILRDGIPWPVEINPRYTASVEVLERALGRSFLAAHRRAFDPMGPGDPSGLPRDRPRRPAVVGKAILFADRPCRFPEDGPRWSGRVGAPGFLPGADLPGPGTAFSPGAPVLTLFARGPDLAACRARLERSLRLWERRLWGPAGL